VKSITKLYVGKDSHKFSAAHMTVFPDGTKESLHGHNFQVQVAIELNDLSFEKFLDFSVLKKNLVAQCKEWDDRLLLAGKCPYLKIVKHTKIEIEFILCKKRYVIPADEVAVLPVENIATEVLAERFATEFSKKLPKALLKSPVVGIEVTIAESNRQGAVHSIRY
jgi:6-pyruvoyltetrahydropterin/6-carboxytetrahydropterin synthase